MRKNALRSMRYRNCCNRRYFKLLRQLVKLILTNTTSERPGAIPTLWESGPMPA